MPCTHCFGICATGRRKVQAEVRSCLEAVRCHFAQGLQTLPDSQIYSLLPPIRYISKRAIHRMEVRQEQCWTLVCIGLHSLTRRPSQFIVWMEVIMQCIAVCDPSLSVGYYDIFNQSRNHGSSRTWQNMHVAHVHRRLSCIPCFCHLDSDSPFLPAA